jgi:hypothetical protein
MPLRPRSTTQPHGSHSPPEAADDRCLPGRERSRTDTGNHPHEAFIRSDVAGRDAVLAWTREHRMASPHPLRHHLTDLHVSAMRPDEADLEGYLFVTTIAEGRPWPMSSGLFSATVRLARGEYRIARKEVVLDTRTSVPFSERKQEVPR